MIDERLFSRLHEIDEERADYAVDPSVSQEREILSLRTAILDRVYRAMRETFDVPEVDRFMTISEHDEPDFSYGSTSLDIARSDDLVIIQITAKNTRTVAQKTALYRSIATHLTGHPGVRPEDIFINLVEVAPENWSFGHGLAQLARGEA